MRSSESYFNKEFINVLINILDAKKLSSIYKLTNDKKYTIYYISDIICAISTNTCCYYRIPDELALYLKKSIKIRFTKKNIRAMILEQRINYIIDDTFLNTYVVIGHDIIPKITELNVIIDN